MWGNVLEGGDWLSGLGGKSREDGCGAWASPSGLILPREGQRRRRSLPWKWRHSDPSAKSSAEKKRPHPIQTCVLSLPQTPG